ncbi:ATP-binding cassette domain-containing protein [Deferribacterales bacterium RsTz2092]|nr:ABC transporter ATP-binding protein [Deferribacterales bacterium]
MSSVLLSTDKICRRYGERWALRPLSVSLNKGDAVAVLGANGAGKSTLLKLLSGQIKPSAGTLTYADMRDDYRSHVGVLSHSHHLYAGLTALENLKFYASLYGVDNPNERALTLLERVEMSKYKDELVRNYSRGMLQRVSIARTMLNEPAIIMMDEPHTGLDKAAMGILSGMSDELRGQGRTLLLITHDISVAYNFADKLLVLSGGQCLYFDKKPATLAECERLYEDML